MEQPLEWHLRSVINSVTNGELVIFLGAGANLCGRPSEFKWRPRDQYLPSGAELAAYLADQFDLPPEEVYDLLRVSQYVDIMQGSGPLYSKLRHVFNADYEPTAVHSLLARLPAMLRGKGYPPHQFIVTTNYDDVLERAFRVEEEPFDLVTYIADAPEGAPERGKCIYRKSDSNKSELIISPNKDRRVSLEERSAILKIHGAVDRSNEDRDSYVITENHYIDYLAQRDISSIVPAKLIRRLKCSNILFLGYSLRDWNLRAILCRIWTEQKLKYASWAIQLNPDELEKRFWGRREIEIIDFDLAQYIALLEEALQEMPPAGD